MTEDQMAVAKRCLVSAEDNSKAFPEIVGMLIDAGFEGYTIDYRRNTAIYYLPNGDSVEYASASVDTPIAADFDRDAILAAIREAQTEAPGYTYKGFSRKVKAAGCAGYLVSFLGRRALYFGRTGETHVELFPQ